jgi:RNA polymerase sigma factor (sigma-70 family)
MSSTAPQFNTIAPQQGGSISAELMARHERLVRWVVRRQYLGNLSFADALHEGRIGLWHALCGYDPARGTAFSSYAVPAIRHAVWEAVAAGRASAASGSYPPTLAEGFDPDEFVHAGQVRASIRALVDQLPSRLRLVVVAHYGLEGAEPESYAAIGRTLGVTRQRVQQLHVEALVWLAHPAHCLALRRLLDRASRADYRQALAWACQVRRRRRGSGRRGR